MPPAGRWRRALFFASESLILVNYAIILIQETADGQPPHSLTVLAVLILLSLPVSAALADYLGPDRTREETREVCKVVLLECEYVPSRDLWKYVPIEDWMCSNEGKPWLAYPDSPSLIGCVYTNQGERYWERRYVTETTTITYPEATISGALNGCTLQNGWCVTAPLLSLTANEPVSGYHILLIEGTRNGETFACQGASCDVPLLEGENTLTFWALSSWGDSSRMGNLTARVDTRPPQVQGELSGTPGEAGWYVSPVTVSASASDPQPGSGLQALTCSLNGGAWMPYTAPLTLSDGLYSITFRAEDGAGHVAEASASIQVDTQPPELQTALEGEQANGWYLSRAVFTASAADGLSGLARIEYALDGGNWQTYGAPVTIGDGQHTLHIRAFDVAGNMSEAAPLTFRVDGTPPRIELTDTWYIWEAGEVTVRDRESGLTGVEIEIRDPQNRWPKVSRAYEASGERFTTTITWDRHFGDGTLAPIGTYDVVVKAFDRAGNVERVTGHILIPAPNVTPTPLPTRTPIPMATATATLPVSSSLSLPAQPAPTATRAPILQSFQSPDLLISQSSNPPSTAPNSSSSVPPSSFPLRGAAAAAAIAAATGLALAAKRRRKDEEREQAERVRAAVEAKNAALEAARRAKMEALKIRNWLLGQAMVRNALSQSGLSEREQEQVRAEARTKGVSAALGLLVSLKQAAQARLEASWRAMENKLQRAKEATEQRAQQQARSGWEMAKWKQQDYTEPRRWQSRPISVTASRVSILHTGEQRETIQDTISKPWWERVLEYKYTPVITGAISVLATDAAFVLLAVSAQPLAPATLALAGLCWGIGRIASIVSVISTGYQYKHDLYGTTRLDVEISIAAYGLSFIPKPDMAVMNHIGFLYSCYTAFWRK